MQVMTYESCWAKGRHDAKYKVFNLAASLDNSVGISFCTWKHLGVSAKPQAKKKVDSPPSFDHILADPSDLLGTSLFVV